MKRRKIVQMLALGLITSSVFVTTVKAEGNENLTTMDASAENTTPPAIPNTTQRVQNTPVDISGMKMYVYVKADGNYERVEDGQAIEYDGEPLTVEVRPAFDGAMLPQDSYRSNITGSNIIKKLTQDSYTELVDIKADGYHKFWDPPMANYLCATLTSYENVAKRLGVTRNDVLDLSFLVTRLRWEYTLEEMRQYKSATDFINKTGYCQDETDPIDSKHSFSYKDLANAWAAEVDTWSGHWDWFLYGEEHFKYWYTNPKKQGPGYNAGNTFQGFYVIVDQMEVTHEPVYEYTINGPGTITISVEGTNCQDGYGRDNLVGSKTITVNVTKKNRWEYQSWAGENGAWFYRKKNGWFAEGWEYIDGQWYYFDEACMMVTGWRNINGVWYYLSGSGAMVTGWQHINGHWYYFDGNGAMTTGWQQIEGKWYYLDGSGAMKTGWLKLGNRWYYLNGSGAMETGWSYLYGKWYYLSESGAMTTGWQYVNGKWYYLNGSGAMESNRWIAGTYFVKGDGVMAVSEWVDNDRYYVDENGVWVPGKQK